MQYNYFDYLIEGLKSKRQKRVQKVYDSVTSWLLVIAVALFIVLLVIKTI